MSPTVEFQKAPRVKIDGLDALRFIAAAAIVLFHLVRMPNLAIPPYFSVIPERFGLGVPLFYMISAFGLALGYSGKLVGSEALLDYFRRRFFRIAPLFYLMVGFYCVYLYLMFGKVITLAQVAASLLFVFNLMPTQVAGFVWASWSIGVEMAFYLVLPILLLAAKSVRSAFVLLAITVFLGAQWASAFALAPDSLKPFGNFFILSYAVYFAAGIACFFIWRAIVPGLSEKSRYRLGLASILCAVVLATVVGTGDFLEALSMNFGPMGPKVFSAVFLFFLVIGIAFAPLRVLVNRVSTMLGKASFSIYLLHPVVIGTLMKLGWFDWLYVRLVDWAAFAASAVMVFSILLPLALLSYRYIELPGMAMASKRRVTSPPPLISAAATATA